TGPRKYACRSHFPSTAIYQCPDGFICLRPYTNLLRPPLPASSTSSPLASRPNGVFNTGNGTMGLQYFNSPLLAYSTSSPFIYRPNGVNGTAVPQPDLSRQSNPNSHFPVSYTSSPLVNNFNGVFNTVNDTVGQPYFNSITDGSTSRRENMWDPNSYASNTNISTNSSFTGYDG
ncbi:hypothetical protein PENTCL1PPCAC_5608, partial [Pristionchus entomophagus]